MNGIEAEFSHVLERHLRLNEIYSYEYEGLTLRWPDGMRYTADFFVTVFVDSQDAPPLVQIRLIEIKGAYAWRQDVVKFRAARARWTQFQFEYWQKIEGVWQQTR